ncbi:recombinase family protein [Streptomyces decoyicus]|uniref:recombinase family protein n=1 Tax=Streptomyces decoyicus TaxID=249567 RepID=UPI0038636552|nr:recombinase family protein [Streptomyces decoyicus]
MWLTEVREVGLVNTGGQRKRSVVRLDCASRGHGSLIPASGWPLGRARGRLRHRRARPTLSQCGRGRHLIAIVGGLRKREIGFQSLHEALDTTTLGGRLVFHAFAALAEFIRELIVQGTHEGIEAARARGERIGRPQAMTPEQIRHARDLLTRPDNTVTSIAKLLGVSRTTLYKYVPELKAGRASLVTGGTPTLPAPRP